LDDSGITDAIENLIIDFADNPEDLPTGRPELLTHLINARAGLLEVIRDAFTTGESAVDALLVHVKAAVSANPVDGSGLDGVKKKGTRLRQLAEQARESLAQVQEA
jgi:hypothetical protein